jgi:hypothetical protein
MVFATREARTETFSDPQRELEHYLLDSARSHLDEPVLEYIGKEMSVRLLPGPFAFLALMQSRRTGYLRRSHQQEAQRLCSRIGQFDCI